MAASATTKRPLTLAGKGSYLTSTDTFDFAHDLASITIDSSAIARRSSSSKSDSKLFSIPEFFTVEETRASLLLLLNKLLLSSSPASATHLLEILEKNVFDSDCVVNDVVSEDLVFFDYSSAAVDGVSALIDNRVASLSVVADAFAALSCEALGADISSFNLADSGDGSVSKDAVSVAADLKVFFNGSKRVGSGKKVMGSCIVKIPYVNGDFRECSRFIHSKTRIQLKSGFRAGSLEGMCRTLLNVAANLFELGSNSIRRASLVLQDSISDKDLSDRLLKLCDAECPKADSIKGLYAPLQAELMEEKYLSFVHKVYELVDVVSKIVSWEAVVAFAALEGSEMFAKKVVGENVIMNEPASGDKAKLDKKAEKKKKVVLGKGTIAFVQFIKEKLGEVSGLEKYADVLLALLNPIDAGFDDLLKKVKDIIESNESRRLPKLPKGTRDFSKEQMAVRQTAFSIIDNVFEKHGATALDTPAFEMRETLTGKYGEDSKLIYDLADQGGELCSLRYDLTVPFARFVAMNGLTSFKRYQIAKVWRRDNPSKGRYREFYQCDFDIAGQFEKMGPDFEVIKILTELLDELNIGEYEVKLNHRKLLDGMLDLCGVPQEKFRTICSSIDKLDKQPFEQIKKEMVEQKGLTVEAADKIGTFVKHRGSPIKLLSQLREEGSEFLKNSEAALALSELDILFKALEKSNCIDKVVFDLSLARGLDYYTGVIFEAVFKGATQVGSIAAGGRYDNLIGMFGTKQVPSVGISLGIERVFAIMEQLQKDKNEEIRATKTQVLVSIMMDDSLPLAAEISTELWDAKIKAEFSVAKRSTKHFDRADNSKIPYMVIVREKEVKDNAVSIRNVTTKAEVTVPRNQLVEKLLELFNGNFIL